MPASRAEEMFTPPALAELLSRHMAERGLTLTALARQADVSKTTIYRWLTGKSVHPYHRVGLLKVAAALDLRKVPASRLLQAAGLPPIESLATTSDTEVLALLRRWLAPVRNNLPAALTSFVGREEEIAEVAQTLCGDVRLITLTGAGGSGKTRLALRVAEDALDNFADGVFFVELAAISKPELLIPAVAEAINLRDVVSRHCRAVS